MTVQLLPLREDGYEAHALHRTERCFMETNCYVDVWIEVLHALGLEPLAAGAFTLSVDFLGDQWTFFKYPTEDLRALYGLEVLEMNIWRPLVDHIAEQLAMGRLMTIEADSYFLPDTHGVAYGERHQKSTIVPQMLDREGRRLGYFHNAGYHLLEGTDFVGALATDADESHLPPYAELILLDRLQRDEQRLIGVATRLFSEHLERRPRDNPIRRLARRVELDLEWLSGVGLDTFHTYAFGTCRQCGAWAETAASFLTWMAGARDNTAFDDAAVPFMEIATGAKSVEFALARAASGRRVDTSEPFEEMAAAWERAIELLEAIHAG